MCISARCIHCSSFPPPAAVVLDRNYTAKICDFGCSRFYSQFDTEPISFIGTVPWMSPEVSSLTGSSKVAATK